MPGEDADPAISAQDRRASAACRRCHGKKAKRGIAEIPASQSCGNCAQTNTPYRTRSSVQASDTDQLTFTHQTFAPAPASQSQSQARSNSAAPHISPNSSSPNAHLDNYLFYPPSGAETGRRHSDFAPASGSLQGQGDLAGVSPNQSVSSHSQYSSVRAGCFGDTGYMRILSRDHVLDDVHPQHGQQAPSLDAEDIVSSALQEGFLESYLEYCFIWCPVLDVDSVQGRAAVLDSPMLNYALALCGNRINPPLIQCRDSAVYYARAKELFYSYSETNDLVRLASIMLFFWWSTGAPNLLNTDNAWWWTGIAIRLAQECRLHRELPASELQQDDPTVGLRRRIWWTLFARDRILAISQGRPTMIDTDYCNVKMVTPSDFPDPSNPKVHIFINWVKLHEITGRISKHLYKAVEDRTDGAKLSQDLISWVQALPAPLHLSIQTSRSVSFDRDVHRLHLAYLTNITLLHMNQSAHDLPRATKAAIVAASCVARLFEDFLARGNIRFLSGDAGWEIAVAILALVSAQRIEKLKPYADADIQTLRTALQQMSLLWPSSRMFSVALDKLLSVDQGSVPQVPRGAEQVDADMLDAMQGGTDWMDYFPFVTEDTSPLTRALLVQSSPMAFTGFTWPGDFSIGLQQFLTEYDDHSFDMFNM